MSASIRFTFRSTSRGCANFGPSDLRYTDEVFASGKVVTEVVGFDDGGRVNQTKTVREDAEGALDLEVVTRARLASGWTKV